MSFYVRNVRPVNSLHSVLRKNNFNVKKIEESLERDSSCIGNVNISDEPPLCDVLRDKNCPSDVIRLVLRYGANVNGFVSTSSETLLNAALEASRDEEVIRLLLENGADVQISRRSPLCVALLNGASKGVVQLLLGAGANVNGFVETPLIAALEASRDEEVIRLLLENGADVQNFPRCPPLCVALCNGASKGVVQMLLGAGCPLNGCAWHDSVLHCAIDNPRGRLNEDVFHLLIERGAGVNAVDQDDQSVLCFALNVAAEVRTIELLLLAGASLTCTQHRSPLLCATTVEADLVKLLLDNGARTDEVDPSGYTPLQHALSSCDYETEAISLLFDCLQGEEAYNVLDDLSRNLLHLAVSNRRCKPGVVELLIKRGFLVNAEGSDRVTPLHEAVVNEVKTSVIKILLKHGAAVNAVDLFGITPFDLAVETRLGTDIVKVLLAAGARIGTHRDHALLKNALDQICRPQRIGIVKKDIYNCALLLMKYYFLENPQFDFQSLVRSRMEYKAFSQFAADCVLELQKMESVIVGHNRTLREFIGGYSPPQRETANNKREEEATYNFDQLLQQIDDYDFPLFLEIISTKVGRRAMDAKLQDIQVYTRKCVPDTGYIGEIIILHYYCVCAIAQYLVDEDLLRLIAAFNYTSDHACTSGQASEKQNLGNKRSSEESAKCLKRLKPSLELQ